MFSGHGCFGEYLYKIGKERTTRCYHCVEHRDTAQHTLEFRPAWAKERRVLIDKIGIDLLLPAIVKEMAGSEEAWKAVISFCSRVMMQKEIAERARERRGRRGRRPLDPEAREEWDDPTWLSRRGGARDRDEGMGGEARVRRRRRRPLCRPEVD